MAKNVKKKIFFLVFCLASITQGMYSTYFVSILTTIERIYQIKSKTAGAIMSATELGQILGSLLIAYYGGKGNKPKWIAACMTLTAIAALISTSPHFLMELSSSTSSIISSQPSTPYLTNDLSHESSASLPPQTSTMSTITTPSPTSLHKLILPTQEHLCYLNTAEPPVSDNSTYSNNTLFASSSSSPTSIQNQSTSAPYNGQASIGPILVIFFLCLLAVGFGSTAITTLGITFIDDIVTREESPLYLGLTIGLRIFGPALGFLLGSFCIGLDVNILSISSSLDEHGQSHLSLSLFDETINPKTGIGAWWLGLIIISIPLLILAVPMYYLSRLIEQNDEASEMIGQFEDITYQAAEDHDIGDSTDFPAHVLTIADLEVTSNTTFYSNVDSSSREVLQARSPKYRANFINNLALDQPIITRSSILNKSAKQSAQGDQCDWTTSSVVVSHFGGLESTSFINEDAHSLSSPLRSSVSSPPPKSSTPSPSSSPSSSLRQSTLNLSSSLSRLINNKLLVLRILSGILHILPVAGFYTFLPKYLIEQFRLAPSSASAISGLAGILFVGFGAFLGGTIMRLLNVNSRMMTRWIASSALCYAIGMLLLMQLGCPQNQIVDSESEHFVTTDCLANCHCSASSYNPVCANGTTYMSPCLAGCKSYSISEDKIIYDECGCSSLSGQAAKPAQELHINLNMATQGHCSLDCDNLKWYIIIFSVFTLVHASSEVGSMMFNLRCVRSGDRALALGLITFSSSLLGTIPCSVIYGSVIDLTCIHWDTLSSPAGPAELGACRAYRNEQFRHYLHGITAFVMMVAFLIDCIICRFASQVDFYDESGHLEKRRLESSKQASDPVVVELKKSTETI